MTHYKFNVWYLIILLSFIILSCGSNVTPDPYSPNNYFTYLPQTPFDLVTAKSNPNEMTYATWVNNDDLATYEDFVGVVEYIDYERNNTRKLAPSLDVASDLATLSQCSMVFSPTKLSVLSNGTIGYEEAVSFVYEDKTQDPSLNGMLFSLQDITNMAHSFSAKFYSYALSDTELADIYKASLAEWYMMAKFDFENNSSSTTTDSMSGYVGDLKGSIKMNSSGTNIAAMFRTTSDYVVVPAAETTDFDFSSEFTIALWVYPDYSSKSPAQLVDKGLNDADNYELYILNQSLRFGWLDSSDGTKKYIDAAGLQLKEHVWTHIAVSINGAGVAFYANGAKIYEEAATISPVTNTDDVYIGRKNSSDDKRSFIGGMDDVTIYNKALSQDDIDAIYASYFIK